MTSGEDREDLLSRPLKDTSVDELAQLFLSNAKPAQAWMVGLELELFGFHQENLRSADHATIAKVLEALGERRNMEREHEPDGALIGLRGGGQSVSLEPGGQLEFATKPYRGLKAMRDELKAYCDDLRAVSSQMGLGFWAMGQQPFVTRETSPKMPKPRYKIMRDYFSARGARALDMMHLTGSVQCTVDFLDEENLTNKVRTAARASPFLSALVAASPFTAGKPNGFKTVRYQIWLETDDARCGIWPEMLDEEGLSVRRYIKKALQTPAFLFVRGGEHYSIEPKPYAEVAKEAFQGTPVKVSDFLDHLTTFFPEIRPKGYVEMRGADCLLPDAAVAVAGFWRGLLDDEGTRLAVEDRLKKMDYEALRALQPKVAKLGLDADSAAGPVKEVILDLVRLAHQRLSNGAPDCAECVLPLLEMAEAGRSPADEMLERAEKGSIEDALRIVTI